MDKHAPELGKMMLDRYLADIRTDPTTKHATGNRPGRSDSVFILRGRGCFIEVKSGDSGWTTRSSDPTIGWTAKQREYGEWVHKINGSEEFICLFVGASPPQYNPEIYLPRRCFLIPFYDALAVVQEAEERLGVSTIPYRIIPHTKNILKEAKMSCEDRFAQWSLLWEDGLWRIPETHVFYEHYIAEVEL